MHFTFYKDIFHSLIKKNLYNLRKNCFSVWKIASWNQNVNFELNFFSIRSLHFRKDFTTKRIYIMAWVCARITLNKQD